MNARRARLTAQTLATGILLAAAAIGALAAPPNDPHYNATGSWGQDYDDQWALKQQQVYSTPVTEEAAEVIVAIIDTGLDYQHEDLAGASLWRNPGEKPNGRDDDGNGFADDLIGWNFVDHNNNPWDVSGHGTHIAGLIAACTDNGIGIAGISPAARLMPLKVANFAGQARSSSVAAAIYYAVDHGARIINLSLGGELVTELEKSAAQYALERDVLIIVAAGNRGLSTERHGYAGLPGVLVVGASDHSGARAGFSNFGNDIALLAPGVEILSLRAADTDFIALTEPLDYPPEAAVVGNDGHYYRASGTSFAAAMTTGIASKILAQRPQLRRAGLLQVLTQSARDVEAPGVDQLSGYGHLNYAAAISADESVALHARLTDAELSLQDQKLWIQLSGTADAQGFAGAQLQLRARPAAQAEPEPEDDRKRRKTKKRKRGDEPDIDPFAWQDIASLSQPVRNGILGSFAVDDFTARTGGALDWELRLQVSDRNGRMREAQMSLSLPAPETQAAEEVDGE